VKDSYYADLGRLTDAAMSYRSAKPLLASLHYDLFTRIEEGFDEVESLARRARLNAPALRRVLDALASMGWLRKRGEKYSNTRSGRRLLVAGGPDYAGDNLKYQEYTWDAWSDLRVVMKTGRPRLGLKDWIERDFFTADYLKAMGDITRRPARELAEALDLRRVSRTLDIGSGAGNFSAAFVERNKALTAVLLDLPAALPVTRSLLKRHPSRDRFEYRPADYLNDEFGRDEFDLALISNVARVENESVNRALVAKAYRALKRGGRLVIHDYAIAPSRTSPTFSALLNVHLLVFTGKGAAYTVAEFRRWMRDAGFRDMQVKPIAIKSPFPSVAVIGRKS
jgi:ubiquinone/menaquinone biosynthesis C-methylase UbiE